MTSRWQNRFPAVRVAIAAGAVMFAASSFSSAQPGNDREAARQLFNEAFTLEKAENWQEAIPKLRAALEILETPGLHYHLAYCLEQQAEIVEALDHYDRAEELLRSGTKAPDVEELLSGRQAALKERVPTVTVRVNEAEKVTKFVVDGALSPLLLLGHPIRLKPGAHQVLVEAEGRPMPLKREITLVERQRATLDMSWPVPEPERAPAPALAAAPKLDTRDSSGVSLRTAVLISEATLAVAGLGVGLGFTLHANALENDADALREELGANTACGPNLPAVKPNCEKLADLVDDQDRARNIALAGFISGGVFAAASIGTWLIWKPKNSAKAPAAVQVVPMGAQGIMWSAVGRF